MRKLPTIPPAAAPTYLDDQAKAKWAELWPTVAQRREPGAATLDALAAYCLAFSRWQTAEERITALGSVVKSPAGFAVPSPYLAVSKAAQNEMRRWHAELKKRS